MTALSTVQESRIKEQLERQRNRRLAAAHDVLLDEHYSIYAGEVPDFCDQATAAQLADFENTLARRSNAAIRDIDDALIRIREHRFGACVDCGDDISFRRLDAWPTATRCVRCQEHHDRTYATGGTPTM